MDLEYYRLSASKRLLYRLKKNLRNLGKGLISGINHLVRLIWEFLGRRYNSAKNFIVNWFRGDIITKLSYAIMGSGHILRGQWSKGILYLLANIFFWIYIWTFGGRYLVLLFENLLTGGPIGRVQTSLSQVWDEDLGEYVKITGDNSFHILLYGILTVFILFFFRYLYRRSVAESFILEQEKAIGKRPDGLKQEINKLGNGKFHLTLLSLPMAGLFLFTVVPLITMIAIAFTNYDADHEVPERLFGWVGFQNFSDMFNGSSALGQTFGRVLSWTLVWAVLATFTSYFFGMILALLINKKGIGFKKFYRTLFISTIAVPQFVSLMIMSKMLDTGGGTFGSGGGIITQLIEQISGYHMQFGLDINTTRLWIIIVNMWIGVPYSMLMCSGILMNIPDHLYESARIDGAGPVRSFFKITLPYMLFVTGPYLITQFIGNINNFNVIYLLSGGGPGDLQKYTNGAKGTDLLITWLYKLSLGTDRNYKLASVIGILVFVISALFSLIIYNRSSAVKGEDNFR